VLLAVGSCHLQERIEQAKRIAADQRKKSALEESYAMRQSFRKAKKPKPTKQDCVVKWMLVRLPLNFVQIPDEAIRQACQRVSLDYDQWRRQDQAFGILKAVYKKRSELRGDEIAKDLKRYLFPQSIEDSFHNAIRIAKEQKSVSLEKRADATYAEYRRQRVSASGGKGFRLPLW
jgi:hypothetical protein